MPVIKKVLLRHLWEKFTESAKTHLFRRKSGNFIAVLIKPAIVKIAGKKALTKAPMSPCSVKAVTGDPGKAMGKNLTNFFELVISSS